MPAFPEEVAAVPVEATPEYSILKQRVDVDVDFPARALKGSTEITVQPLVKDVKHIRLHCRQCKPTSVQAGGITAKWTYADPYKKARMPDKSTVHQYEMLKAKIEKSLKPAPEPEMVVSLPPKLKIQELQVEAEAPLTNGQARQENGTGAVAVAVPETPVVATAQQSLQFAPFKVFIEFEVEHFRDGLHWVGYAEGDKRFPYMYSKMEPIPGTASCIFPCVDDATSRCSWEFAISSYRTLGGAFRKRKGNAQQADVMNNVDTQMVNGTESASKSNDETAYKAEDYLIDLAEDEAGLDLAVVCVGEQIEDVPDPEDESRHTVTYSLTQPVAARHVGFAVGPFEQVDLSSMRGSEEEERFGQTAVKAAGYCLPGKSADVKNTCTPIAWAIDQMGVKYGSFPFSSYQMLFVDDFVHDTVSGAGLSMCSSGLLVPKTIIEPLDRNTRILIRSLAEQWSGVNVIAHEPTDFWVISGMAGFMTDMYMKDLAGNNEFRWRQKQAAEKIYDLDVDRPSIRQLGELLHLDHTIREFVDLKSALVLFILDRRMMKTTGMTGVQRIISKIFLNAKTGTLVNGEVSTLEFQRMCERLGHTKLEPFFRQWVYMSGCPIFYVTQRFNKKKTVVEMVIVQKQLERVTKPPFEPSNFMREIKEHVGEVWAPETTPVFTGPMTIRIHEADGTPYEHIVEIKEAVTKVDISYNTKYKRLKRSRKQKERQMAEGVTGDGGDDALLYCLGDILDSKEEREEWNLVDWTQDDQDKMGQESYEWIRMDADFEWIGKVHLVMPLYMYISQLQQDRDIVAQYESMRYLLGSNPHHVSLSILVRTLMDSRYFWGIREMAADGLAVCAKEQTRELGIFHLTKAFRTMFCLGDTNMPKPNDFSDRRQFILQCAIPRAMAKLRDADGKVPMEIRQFFVDILKFNDNSNNILQDGAEDGVIISDNHYIATLMHCLADSLIASHREPQPTYSFSFGEEDLPMEEDDGPDAQFENLAIAQIERHRRIDEWDSSYQNIYSITALDCLQRLTKAGIVKEKTAEVMKYVRSGNADNVRLAAFRCLSEIGVLRKMSALRYVLYELAVDQSPFFRDRLFGVLGEALGHIALGDSEPVQAAPQPAADTGLVLEQETSSEARKLEATRKTTPEGALLALKVALEKEDQFKEGLWLAATAPDASLDEIAAICDIAALIYEPIESHTITLNLPRTWKCRHEGSGKIRFTPHGPYRSIPPKKQLSAIDYKNISSLELSYNGPLSDEARRMRDGVSTSDLKLKLKPSSEQPLQALAVPTPSSATATMPPPTTIVPSTEKASTPAAPSLKLNLGKRKQSVDFGDGATPRASSPKAQKTSRQQTPSGSIQTPKGRGSPAGAKANTNGDRRRRSSTPQGPKGSKAKKSKVVALRLGNSSAKAYEILSSPPQPGRDMSKDKRRSITPLGAQQGSSLSGGFAGSPTGAGGNGWFPGSTGSSFSASPAPSANFGGFRSYGPPPDAPPEVKQEPTEVEASPAVQAPAVNGGSATQKSSASPAAEMPPPPKPKFKLKLGRKSSDSSPVE